MSEMNELEIESTVEVAEAEAPAPSMIIVDKRLAEALALLGVNVYE